MIMPKVAIYLECASSDYLAIRTCVVHLRREHFVFNGNIWNGKKYELEFVKGRVLRIILSDLPLISLIKRSKKQRRIAHSGMHKTANI